MPQHNCVVALKLAIGHHNLGVSAELLGRVPVGCVVACTDDQSSACLDSAIQFRSIAGEFPSRNVSEPSYEHPISCICLPLRWI
jgi:hypothetical protein